MEKYEILENLIRGRVKPYIYAFSTNIIPNYLKIGDTYRAVQSRLNEWKRYYPDLKEEFKAEAMINDDVFFRDYAVHKYVQEDLGRIRIEESKLKQDVYYSNEFFKNATTEDVKEAIKDIKESYKREDNKYQFYDAYANLPMSFHFEREKKEWNLRPNQKDVVENFIKAKEAGRKNLLMYAVMRFGKSFTSMMCAKEMGANLVVVVSAKADVKIEWQGAVEKPKNFDKYEFITSEDLLRNNNEITEKLRDNKKIVVFLTLQDLQGKLIKEKHRDIFGNKIDLLIVDETHFGARAEKYGELLKKSKYEKDIKDRHKKEEKTLNELDNNIKILDVNITLHLSGTPYRILMGSEFEKEDIISYCQFSDIVKEQEKWDEEHFKEIENGEINEDTQKPYQVWDNPYFGFPQMIRFAFNPSKKAREKLKEYRINGHTYAFSALLKPVSKDKKPDNSHKKFINEQEILELLEVIDGSKKDENVLGFLNYDKIKQGKMCRHIVCVLPYCASCDALKELILSNKDRFTNLNEYEIINISGVENEYRNLNQIKNKIEECEKNNKKTLTLTVNRMLTGSTVKEWDTMIYLKDTSSPQEYDQAIFRLQNQYVRDYLNSSGDVIKYNMKPQTLLVDFDPYRLFSLQEKKALIYNVNSDEIGNSILKGQIEKELKISPIISMNKDKIVEITPTDIMEVVSEYSRNKGVLEETNDIPVDLSLLNYQDIRKVIEEQGEIGSKQSIFADNAEDEGNDLEIPEEDNDNQTDEEHIEDNGDIENNEEKKLNDPVKQFRTYYAKILFYAFLTESKVISIDEIIKTIISDSENRKLAKNLGLNIMVLASIRKHMNWSILNQLEYKIQNINNLARDNTIEPIQRAKIAVNKFNKLSDSEIVTPDDICKDIINLITKEEFNRIINSRGKFLDIASTMGEFSVAIYERALIENKNIDMTNSIYAIPTSNIAYEFTKKIYKILNLNVDNIARMFNTYDFLNIKENKKVKYADIRKYLLQDKKFSEIQLSENTFFKKGEDKMKFDIIVGNPPYQLKGGSGGNNDALIFQYFANIAEELKPEYISLIIPSRWFSGGRDNLVRDFRNKMLNNRKLEKMVVYSDASKIFDNVEIKGGVCYYLINDKYEGDCTYTLYQDDRKEVSIRKLNDFDILIREPKIEKIVKKVVCDLAENQTVETMISSDTPFGIGSNPKSGKKYSINVFDESTIEHDTKLFFIEKQKRKIEYVSKNEVTKNTKDIDKFKVFIPANAGSGNDPYIIGKPEIANKNSVCSQSYLYAAFETEEEAINFVKYMKTKFFRILVKAAKITQGASNKVYRFVPKQNFSNNSDINWNADIPEINNQLCNKYGIRPDEMQYIEKTIKEF